MTFYAGQKVRASELNDAVPIIGYTTSDSTATSTTTLANVTGLSVSLDASTTYIMDGYLAYTANETADIKFAITVPTGASGHWGLYPITTSGVNAVGSVNGQRNTAFGDATTQAASGSALAGNAMLCLPRGYVVTSSAGTLQFRFAQNTSNATGSVVKTGSWIRLLKVA